MGLTSLLITLMIAAGAVAYGVTSGQAKAGRLRELHRDLKERKPRGFAVVAGVLAMIGAVWLYNQQYRSVRYEDILRAQFHLPADIPFAEIRYPSSGTANKAEGIVQFTAAQFAAYRSSLTDRNIWTPVRSDAGGPALEGPVSPRALQWQALPKPIFAGTRRVRWGNLSRQQVGDVEQGQVLCIALRRPPGQRKARSWRPAPKGHEHLYPLETPVELNQYKALNCAELGRSEQPHSYILGVLDFDTRALHMIIR